MIGKLPAGSYTVSVYQPQSTQVATAQFVVADKYAAASGPHPLVDYTDHWWNAQESGWGLSIMQHTSDRLFATWYVYDQNMQPTWYTLQPGSWTNFKTYAGPIYRTTGPFYGGPFNPNQVSVEQVGVGTLTFADAAHGEFSYTINGVDGSKAITRLPF
jgi:hypothetical protein